MATIKKNFHKKSFFFFGVSVVALMAGGQAIAQDGSPNIKAPVTPGAGPAGGSIAAPNAEVAGDLRPSGNAAADDRSAGDIVVTGTRIISSVNAASPTPITAISAEQLLQTTPADIPTGLNKLPVFQGSLQPRRPGGGGGGAIAQNVLNLRNFGAQRTLILVDGHRVAASNPSGTTDIDTIPQMLISRVDVTTGGASAVYGSDAVTGVVNFVLDKRFNGVKVEANGGISRYGDAASGKIGIAAGTSLFDGKGHLEGSFRYRQQAPIKIIDRPDGQDVYVRTGNGTNAFPYTITKNARLATSSYGGLITNCTATCPSVGMNFNSNGVLGPFYPGTPTGTAGTSSGGDGAYSVYSDALVAGHNTEVFGRFDYDFDDGIKFFVQGSYADAETNGNHFPLKLTPTKGQASIFYKNNPYLTAATRTQLGDNGRSDATNTFQLGTYIISQGPDGFTGTRNTNDYGQIQAGFNGKIGRLHWDAFYTHGENRLDVDVINNQNYQKLFAALDGVTGANGTVQCYAATQAATAAAYAGCVPLNAFGPTAITSQAFGYFTQTTHSQIDNTLDDVGGTLTGSLFKTWAGPVDFALSVESRWNAYEVRSDTDPSSLVDCTGLRLCNAALQLYAQPVSGSIKKSNSVQEVAGELSIPLIKEVPLIQSITADLAGRYTHYSTSGDVQTWKAGLDWAVNDAIRFRGTASRDIRAPTLDDLFRPLQGAVQAFNDVHTNTNGTVYNYTVGNPNLVPEVARTYTAGVVLTPTHLLRGFSASFDWYKIKLNNAIGQIAASTTAIQSLCEVSNGTSQYCALFQRPLPFSDRSPANYPTKIFTQNLNTALTQIEGFDIEADYRFRAIGGAWSLRLFANVQQTNKSQGFPDAPLTYVASSKTRITGFADYQSGGWDISIQDRWQSGFDQRTTDTQVYANPWAGAFNATDATLQWKTKVAFSDTAFFVTVENIFDAKGPIVGGTNVGGVQPYPEGYDVLGRYFTFGIKAKF